MEKNTDFCERLKQVVDTSGKYQYTIATEIGIDSVTLSRYINGTRVPDILYVAKLANYFRVSADWLIGISDDKYASLSTEVQEVVNLYSVADDSDRNVVQTVLEKYKNKNTAGNVRRRKVMPSHRKGASASKK